MKKKNILVLIFAIKIIKILMRHAVTLKYVLHKNSSCKKPIFSAVSIES